MADHNMLPGFSTNLIADFDYGDAEGFKDARQIAQDKTLFIRTSSIREFTRNRHDIIAGYIGTGKSLLYALMKEHQGDFFPEYNRFEIVAIDQKVDFQGLLDDFEKQIGNLRDKRTLLLIWKTIIYKYVVEKLIEIGKLNPKSHPNLEAFFACIASSHEYTSYLDFLNSVVSMPKLSFAGPANTEISFETKGLPKKQIALARLINIVEKLCCDTLEKNSMEVLVLIDRVDNFVGGKEYELQKNLVEAAIEIISDLNAKSRFLNFKLFLREDLFQRIEFEDIGYDKSRTRVLSLEWNSSEINQFIAARIAENLERTKIVRTVELLKIIQKEMEESHAEEERERQQESSLKRLLNWIAGVFQRKPSLNAGKLSSVYEDLARQVITKVFPRKVVHYSEVGAMAEIDLFKFLETHFVDAHKVTTPRRIQLFLNNVNRLANDYFEESDVSEVPLTKMNGSLEWALYRKEQVLLAYQNVRREYLMSVNAQSERWAPLIRKFLGTIENKETMPFRWVRDSLGLSEEEAKTFCAYLEHIGFFAATKPDNDIVYRKYKLPIIYKPKLAP